MRNGDGMEKNIEMPAPKNTEKPIKCHAMRKSGPTEAFITSAMTATALIPNNKSGSDPRITKWSGSSPCRYLMTVPIANTLNMWIAMS